MWLLWSDLGQSQQVPVVLLALPPPQASASSSVPVGCYALSFNPRLRDFLASGDSCGRVQLWQLSWRLANLQPGEQQHLARLAGDDSQGVAAGQQQARASAAESKMAS